MIPEKNEVKQADISKGEKNISSCLRIATASDALALVEFYRMVFGDTDRVAKAYAEFALKAGKTYIYDFSNFAPFIGAALTVVDGEDGEKFLSFGGTIPFIRNRGIFSTLLKQVAEEERRITPSARFICPTKKAKDISFLRKRGFIYFSLAIECKPVGGNDRYPKLRLVEYSESTHSLMHEFHFGKNSFPIHALEYSHRFYRATGGYFAIVGDGFISFRPAEERFPYVSPEHDIYKHSQVYKHIMEFEGFNLFESEKKGKYIIDQCAVDLKKISSFSPSFERCILPCSALEEVKKAGMPYMAKITAVADFPMEERYINALYR